jgi:thioredoxin-like negative regulator of GroEL
MIPILETLAEQYEGLAVVGKINLSQNYDSAKFYQITSIPTFLLFQNDQVQAAYTGIQSGETLATMIADYIND